MKIETVAKVNLEGEYEVLYMGKDRGVARNVYKEHMSQKDSFLALFQQSGYASRTMSKSGHMTHRVANTPVVVEEKPKRRRSKKDSEG